MIGDPDIVKSLSIDVPFERTGGGVNGAITELGFTPSKGETRRARASRFFLENVNLTGRLEIVVPKASVTASFGFLAIKASGSGTLPVPNTDDKNRLVDLALTLALRNPRVLATHADNDKLDIAVLGNALGDGKLFYDAAKAGVGGSDEDPSTGFVLGTLTGGLGAELEIRPAGPLSGLGKTLNAKLTVTAASDNWFDHLPAPKVDFTGPDLEAILDNFSTLDFASVIRALRLIVDFLRGLDESTAAARSPRSSTPSCRSSIAASPTSWTSPRSSARSSTSCSPIRPRRSRSSTTRSRARSGSTSSSRRRSRATTPPRPTRSRRSSCRTS